MLPLDMLLKSFGFDSATLKTIAEEKMREGMSHLEQASAALQRIDTRLTRIEIALGLAVKGEFIALENNEKED